MTSDYGKSGGGGGDVGGCGGASSAIKERLLPDNRATRQRVNSDPVSNKKCIQSLYKSSFVLLLVVAPSADKEGKRKRYEIIHHPM